MNDTQHRSDPSAPCELADELEALETRLARPLSADELTAKLDPLEAEVEAQGFVDIMKSQRMHELRRRIYFLRLRASVPEGATP